MVAASVFLNSFPKCFSSSSSSCFCCNSMPLGGCSALHGMNPSFCIILGKEILEVLKRGFKSIVLHVQYSNTGIIFEDVDSIF